MTTSLAGIYNMALSHVGNSDEVQDPNENTPNANACRRFYEPARNRVLEDFGWPFAKKTAVLALVAADPTSEWSFSYRYPSDCIAARRIVSPTYSLRGAGPQAVIPYLIGGDDTGSLIYCDLETASLEYTQLITTVTRFTASFVDALSLRLAWLIAPRVTGGDPYKLGMRALQLYTSAIMSAQANALNEQQDDQAPGAEWISDRG